MVKELHLGRLEEFGAAVAATREAETVMDPDMPMAWKKHEVMALDSQAAIVCMASWTESNQDLTESNQDHGLRLVRESMRKGRGY